MQWTCPTAQCPLRIRAEYSTKGAHKSASLTSGKLQASGDGQKGVLWVTGVAPFRYTKKVSMVQVVNTLEKVLSPPTWPRPVAEPFQLLLTTFLVAALPETPSTLAYDRY